MSMYVHGLDSLASYVKTGASVGVSPSCGYFQVF